MTDARYVLVGLAHVRSGWFTDIARWSTLEALPIEFVKCLSASELHARIDAGRAISAVIVDLALTVVDQDLVDGVRRRGIPVIVVEDVPGRHPWIASAPVDVLPASFDRSALLGILATSAEQVAQASDDGFEPALEAAGPHDHKGPLVAVIGRPGAGTSTLAIALAQGLADASSSAAPVILADLALHAHQALLHDAGDVIPGLIELLEPRGGAEDPLRIDQETLPVPHRGYRILLGLRRHRDWVLVRQRTLRAAMQRLTQAAAVVVADVTGDIEGEPETGSFDIDDRNMLARFSVSEATVVVAVANATTTGLHGVVTLLDDLRNAGVEAERTLVVFNRAPSRPRQRADLTRSLAGLVASAGADPSYCGPLFIPERRGLDLVHLRVGRMPASITSSLGRAVSSLLERTHQPGSVAPRAIRPSELAGGR